MALLTDTKARSVKPGGTPIAHGGVTGLALDPSPTNKGQGKWFLRYVSPVTKKRRKAGLGSYPVVGIAEAAQKARLMREQLARGADPLEIKANEATRPPRRYMRNLRRAGRTLSTYSSGSTL
jgi:Arm DNA-binding domain